MLPFDQAGGRSSSETCHCEPIVIRRDLAAAAPSWRLGPPQKQRLSTAAALDLHLPTIGSEGWR
jgi:hypothetical protein